LADTITQWHTRQPFDAVLTFCSGMVRYARLIKGAKQLMDLVDVDSVKWDSYAMASLPPKRWVYQHEAKFLRRIEAGVYDRFDAMTVVSERESKTYQHYVGANPKLHVVGNGVDLDYFSPLPDATGSKKILFVGVLNYRPNVEAVSWFAKQVMPLLRSVMSDCTFEIVGREPTQQVMELGKLEGVNVIGPVDDVRKPMAEAGVVVAPLRIARGVQNKVLEAMACQRVVVCSPQAAEGVNAMDGSHYLIGHLPDQWARHVEWMLCDDHRRQQMASAARQWVCEQYTWDVQLAPMLDLLLGKRTGEQSVTRHAA
jgi:sugar transferase (PEP-CTERM/EpsH1 system associated)